MARELRTYQGTLTKERKNYYLFYSLGLQIAFWQFPYTCEASRIAQNRGLNASLGGGWGGEIWLGGIICLGN